MRENKWSLTVRMGATALALVLALASVGCSASSTGGGETTITSMGYGTPSAVAPGAPENLAGSAQDSSKGTADRTSAASSAATQKLTVVNKAIRIETKDVNGAIDKIRSLADRDGAEIASMQVSTSSDQPIYPQAIDSTQYTAGQPYVQLKAYVTVRVPSAKFAAFVAEVAKLGTVLYQYQSSEDVTQQHVDMVARLANMKAEETRLRALFNQATKVSDMLAIEQELTRVQGEIESMQAQITYLEDQAAKATVTIELKEPTPVVSPSGIDWGTQTAFTNSVRAFVNTFNGLIVLLGPVLALLIFVGLPVLLVVWIIRRRIRRRRMNHAAAPEQPAQVPPTPPTADAQ